MGFWRVTAQRHRRCRWNIELEWLVSYKLVHCNPVRGRLDFRHETSFKYECQIKLRTQHCFFIQIWGKTTAIALIKWNWPAPSGYLMASVSTVLAIFYKMCLGKRFRYRNRPDSSSDRGSVRKTEVALNNCCSWTYILNARLCVAIAFGGCMVLLWWKIIFRRWSDLRSATAVDVKVEDT